jgi:purine-nucleoside phosphorylase
VVAAAYTFVGGRGEPVGELPADSPGVVVDAGTDAGVVGAPGAVEAVGEAGEVVGAGAAEDDPDAPAPGAVPAEQPATRTAAIAPATADGRRTPMGAIVPQGAGWRSLSQVPGESGGGQRRARYASRVTEQHAAPDLSDPATDPFEVAGAAAAVIAERTGAERHDVALVLGSGWGQTGDLIGETLATIDNADVPGFAKAAVEGHSGTMRSVAIGDTGRRALVYGTRTHFYEGRGVRAVVHAVRTAAAAGCRTIVLTNGCGGLNPAWAPGTPVLIRDHINLTAHSPIEGANFVDLTDLYSPRLRDLAREVDGDLDEGVYVQFRGPHYETPAEVQMARTIGGDLVGMSTTLEAIAARQAGMEVLGISLVTNLAAGISEQPLSHAEVIEAGQAAAGRCGRLLAAVVATI